MKILGIQQLRERIDEILCWVEEGEIVEVTDKGKVVMRLHGPMRPRPFR